MGERKNKEWNPCLNGLRKPIRTSRFSFARTADLQRLNCTVSVMRTKHHVMFDEFPYQAGSWKAPLRVICRIERAAGELLPRATFIVTTLKAEAKVIVKTYSTRGNTENFIKEAKINFSMETVSHCSFTANAVKCLTKALAYSIVNGMKCTAFSKDRKSSRMLSIRTDLVKIACRVVVSARRTTFKLCSSSPFKDVFYQVMQSIEKLQFVSLQA